MDSNEATTVVLSRIKSIDPENATKIMGYLLIQDLDEKDLIRLAFGPEAVLHSYILKAKSILSRSSAAFPGPSTPPSPSPFLGSVARSNHHFMPPLSSPRLAQRSDFDMGKSPKSPFCPFPGNPMSPSSNPPLPFGGSQRFQGGSAANGGDFAEEQQLNEFFPFLNDSVSNVEEPNLHRRSYSDGDAFFASEDGEFCGVNRPCHYYARGSCKNGTGCKFLHGGGTSDDFEGSASGAEQMLRLKLAQHHQRMASAAASQFLLGTSPSSYEKYMNSLLQHPNDPQRMASMMMAEDMYKYGRLQQERSDLLAMSIAEKSNSAARQIYLTFPADSTFKDEDVSEYFSTYGPVQDVRIPYQQKRMFGFVTFHFSETVRLILAKGNPHFICNSRVLVKPYKEKGKLLEKKQMHQQQLFERGEFSPSSNSSFPDSRDSYESHGPRNSNMMMLRRKLEQEADLQQAIEFQGRRLMNLQLPDLKNDSAYHHHMQRMSMGSAPIPIAYNNQSHHRAFHQSDFMNNELLQDCSGSPATSTALEVNAAYGDGTEHEGETSNPSGVDCKASMEHILPNSPFASPTKSDGDNGSEFATKVTDASEGAKTATVSDNNVSSLMNSPTGDGPPASVNASFPC